MENAATSKWAKIFRHRIGEIDSLAVKRTYGSCRELGGSVPRANVGMCTDASNPSSPSCSDVLFW